MDCLNITCAKLMVFLCFGLVQLCTVNPVSSTSKTCRFPAIFAFGTSNTETGGYGAIELFANVPFPLNPPYGETYFGRPSGRFSDGRIILDFIGISISISSHYKKKGG